METENKKSEVKEFLDYCVMRRKITEEQSKIILEKIEPQLLGALNFDEFEGLNKEFEEWRKKRKEIKERIIPQILPKKCIHLLDEEYLIDYLLGVVIDFIGY